MCCNFFLLTFQPHHLSIIDLYSHVLWSKADNSFSQGCRESLCPCIGFWPIYLCNSNSLHITPKLLNCFQCSSFFWFCSHSPSCWLVHLNTANLLRIAKLRDLACCFSLSWDLFPFSVFSIDISSCNDYMGKLCFFSLNDFSYQADLLNIILCIFTQKQIPPSSVGFKKKTLNLNPFPKNPN